MVHLQHKMELTIFFDCIRHCRRGDNFSVGFFLKNLRRHVHDTSHFFCLRHITQNFLRGHSNDKHLKKPLMLAGYAYMEKMHWGHLGDIIKCTNGLINYPKNIGYNASMRGKTFVDVIVEEMYFKTAKLFAIKGRQTKQGSTPAHNILKSSLRPNPHFKRTQTTWNTLQSQNCNCGEYQVKHLPCSHVMAAYKFVNVDPMNYVLSLFTLQNILHIYDNSFGLLSHELIWQEYEGDQWSTNPRRKRSANGRSGFNSHS
ncbi:hypothetical protein HKD37_20G056423 [Glycine soja]